MLCIVGYQEGTGSGWPVLAAAVPLPFHPENRCLRAGRRSIHAVAPKCNIVFRPL